MIWFKHNWFRLMIIGLLILAGIAYFFSNRYSFSSVESRPKRCNKWTGNCQVYVGAHYWRNF